MEKEEYIRKLKQLIKKYHPDLCKDLYLEGIYNEITIKLNQKLNQIRTENNIKENTQSYEYYKLGIKFYKNIHPNKFYKRNVDGTLEPKKYGEQLKLLNKIFISFNTAEYYFTKVITEYPESEWTVDAKEKIKLLKKLYKSYENINIEENNKIIDNNKFIKEMGLKIL
jgi:predicted Zn-dependent protease